MASRRFAMASSTDSGSSEGTPSVIMIRLMGLTFVASGSLLARFQASS